METADERRRFFRINDKIGISYKIINRLEQKEKKIKNGDLKNLLSVQDDRLEHILVALNRKDMQVAEALALINKKINLIANYLEIERGRVDDVEYIVKHVNISACGLAFMADEYLEPGTTLEVELLLGSESGPMVVEGVVISCDRKTERQHYLRIDFDVIDTGDQETLIQYMVKRQSELLREMSQKSKTDPKRHLIN